jgi:para-aminobenzoate synthetase/4-amino-4-deoxychorismate lyase
VILWNPAGEVTETTIANIVVEINARRVTPPIACGLLPGTLRAELLATGDIREARVTIVELKAAARFWMVNSVRGWCPAMLIDAN